MQSHQDLIVWKKSMEHVTNIYMVTRDYPKEEFFGIVSQMRRAAVSIPSNIAEGYGRLYGKETVKFLALRLNWRRKSSSHEILDLLPTINWKKCKPRFQRSYECSQHSSKP